MIMSIEPKQGVHSPQLSAGSLQLTVMLEETICADEYEKDRKRFMIDNPLAVESKKQTTGNEEEET